MGCRCKRDRTELDEDLSENRQALRKEHLQNESDASDGAEEDKLQAGKGEHRR